MKRAEPRQRGQIEARGENRWLVRVYLGRDTEGKRKYHAETVKGTFSEANKKLTKKLSELDSNSFVEPTKLSVMQYCKQWLESKADISVKTREDYSHRLSKDVYPHLGTVRLDKLSPLQVQQWVKDLSARGLSPRTVNYSYTVLATALSEGIEKGILGKTACRGINLPQTKKLPPEVWTASEVQKFLSKTSESPDHTLWLTVLTTGMRPEEYLALQWSEVDLDSGVVRIVRALNQVEKGNYVVGQPKTDASWRTITIPTETIAALKAHKAKQNATILKAGELYQRKGFVFAGRLGNFQDISAVRRRFKNAAAEAEVKEIPLYNMRHTHATLLLSAGEHPKVVQERLGHSSITVTMDTYSHVLQSMQTQTAAKVSAILFSTQPQAVAL